MLTTEASVVSDSIGPKTAFGLPVHQVQARTMGGCCFSFSMHERVKSKRNESGSGLCQVRSHGLIIPFSVHGISGRVLGGLAIAFSTISALL